MKSRLKLLLAFSCALITAAPTQAAPLPDPWIGSAIGETNHPGGIEQEGELFKINGSGYQISSGDDAFYSLPGFNTPQLAARKRWNRETVKDELPLAQKPQCDDLGLPSGVSGEVSSCSFR